MCALAFVSLQQYYVPSLSSGVYPIFHVFELCSVREVWVYVLVKGHVEVPVYVLVLACLLWQFRIMMPLSSGALAMAASYTDNKVNSDFCCGPDFIGKILHQMQRCEAIASEFLQ
ncbi:hypothetical protein E2542_SST03493 [Spatholobus suberectus]|nr:hypothetical protein E2542_SST03493 [Spatholobus suberectus]